MIKQKPQHYISDIPTLYLNKADLQLNAINECKDIKDCKQCSCYCSIRKLVSVPAIPCDAIIFYKIQLILHFCQ